MSTSYPVYIIDDDRDVRASLAFMLGAEGIAGRAFGSGSEFLQAIPELAPGCVLLDIRMPGMSGLDVLHQLKQRRVTWPVVVMTGHGEQEIATQAISLGAVDFVEKPFDEDMLLSCLANACAKLRD
jgi:two-component system response regulator FixJ